MEPKQNENFSFEEAYARLEGILSELNSGETPLETSLKLYEEANKLITLCSSKLNQAEQKIEMLIKSRDEAPQVAPFTPESEKVLDTAHDTYS
ncbi:MAG: exodeoxyribonuclease VII small subunit [Chlamydiia bacterium]|nr:exodeoxyribonuclease VII small subunit [Chlamydiia bacterium]